MSNTTPTFAIAVSRTNTNNLLGYLAGAEAEKPFDCSYVPFHLVFTPYEQLVCGTNKNMIAGTMDLEIVKDWAEKENYSLHLCVLPKFNQSIQVVEMVDNQS